MSTIINQRWTLARRPIGRPTLADFALKENSINHLDQEQVLIKIDYFSLDPYMRGRMSTAKSYAPPLAIGDTLVGEGVGHVVASRNADFQEGDAVLCASGWQRYYVSDGKELRKLNQQVPISTALGVLGMPGFTAYSGLLTIGQPKMGETVVVAAATGPVGSAVGQIAKIKGARTIGIAGGNKKCQALIEQFHFDVAIDHYATDFAKQLTAACPHGIDIYFENVGGKVWDAVLPLLNSFARVPICGLVSQYNAHGIAETPDRLPLTMATVLARRILIRGFIQTDFIDAQYASFLRDMQQWLEAGQVHYLEDIIEGLDCAPEAFIGLLDGKNFGKLLIKP